MSTSVSLLDIYRTLLHQYGPQHWWPGDSPFEIMVGGVLTQNTNWQNVERAIANLKKAGGLTPQAINNLTHDELAERIRPAGYFNIKAKRLKNLIHWFLENYQGRIDNLTAMSVDGLREELLSVNGIGRETADSIILYALNKLSFVVDAYTFRILARHHCIYPDVDYEELKSYCEGCIPAEVADYNECHALLVRVGKDFCKPKPKCQGCPLESFDHDIEIEIFSS